MTNCQHVPTAVKAAEICCEPNERRALLNFAVVGVSLTDEELAGVIAELAKASLVHDFCRIDPSDARIILIEAGPRILASFPRDCPAVDLCHLPPRCADYSHRERRRCDGAAAAAVLTSTNDVASIRPFPACPISPPSS